MKLTGARMNTKGTGVFVDGWGGGWLFGGLVCCLVVWFVVWFFFP